MNQPSQSSALAEPFDRVLEKFGTNVPQIATVVAVVLGSLQFDDFFNAGAWTVMAVLVFALVYLYRRQVPRNLLRTTAYISLLLAIAAVPPLLLARNLPSYAAFLDWISAHKILATAYASTVTSAALALLLTSYQHQERVHGWTFPQELETAIENQITASPFYKSGISFDVCPIEITPQHLVLDIVMKYLVTNRTEENRDWDMHFRLSDPRGQFLRASFDGRNIDINNPDYQIGRGISIPCPLKPQQTGCIEFHVRQSYRHKDSELLTSYTPATDLSLTLTNPMPEVRFNIELLYFRKKQQIEHDGTKQFVALNEGILPFQGLRLNWEVTDATRSDSPAAKP